MGGVIGWSIILYSTPLLQFHSRSILPCNFDGGPDHVICLVNEMLAFHIMASHNMVNNLGMGVERLNTEQSRCALHTAEAWNVSVQLNLFPLRSTITMRKACSLWHTISRQEIRDSCRITGHPSCLNQIQYTSDNLKPTSSYIS